LATVTIRLPKGISEEEIKAVVERYVKMRLEGMRALDRMLSERGLDEESLREFEEFRDEL